MVRKTFVSRFFADRNGFDSLTFEELLTTPVSNIKKVFSKLSYAGGCYFSNLFPSSWDGWRTVKWEPPTKLIVPSLRWHAIKIESCAEKLRKCLRDRQEIQEMFLLGRFKDSLRAIKTFEKRYGKSLWSLNQFFRICEAKTGTDFNRTELQKFTKTEDNVNQHQRWSNFLASIFSMKCELELSQSDFSELLRYLDAAEDDFSDYSANYLRYRVFSITPSDEKAVTDILHYESRHSILDLLDTYSILLHKQIARSLPVDLITFLVEISNKLNDNTFSSIVAIFDGGDCFEHSQSDALTDLVAKSFDGDFPAALAGAASYIREKPDYFCAYQIGALAAAHAEDLDTLTAGTSRVQEQLLQAIYQWYSVDTNRTQAAETLKRLARFHSATKLGWGLQQFTSDLEDSTPETLLASDRVSLVSTPQPVFQHIFEHPDSAKQQWYLTQSENLGASEFCVNVAREVVRSNSDGNLIVASGVCQERHLHQQAIIFYGRGKHVKVSELLEELRRDFPKYYALRPDVQCLEVATLIALGRFESSASLASSLYVSNPNSVPMTILASFGDHIVDEDNEFSRSNIAWPIIATAARTHSVVNLSLDRLHDFVGDFIESHNCTLPTELLMQNQESLSPEQFVFFRDCCTTEIMESSFWIDSQEALLKERLTLCEKIEKLMEIPPAGIDDEIGSLTRKLSVIELTQRIERSRVFVDIEKIKERIPENIRDTTRRVLASVSLNNRELSRTLKLLGMPSQGEGDVVVVTMDRGQKLFESVFNKLKETYLFSPELGLDANLSQSIRHGPIISGIRSIFDKSKLVTRKSKSEQYQENKYWSQRLPNYTQECEEEFSRLSGNVDRFIKEVRDNEVQIRTSDNESGAFHFEFSPDEIKDIFSLVEPLHEVEDVFDIILSALVQRTKLCLDSLRARINDDWSKLLSTQLSELESSVANIVGYSNAAPLRSAATDCRTELSRGLDNVSGWFHLDNRREQKSFALRSLLKTFEKMATRVGQTIEVTISDQCAPFVDQQISGELFRPFWNLLLNLFDNVLNHSGLDENSVEFDIKSVDGQTTVTCANDLDTSVDVDALEQKISQLNGLSLDTTKDLLKLRSEGGSGIAKLHKIVRYELCGDNEDYSIELSLTEEREFSVRIELGMELLA